MAPGDVRDCFPKMADFRALLSEFDPQGKFMNDYLVNYMSPSA